MLGFKKNKKLSTEETDLKNYIKKYFLTHKNMRTEIKINNLSLEKLKEFETLCIDFSTFLKKNRDKLKEVQKKLTDKDFDNFIMNIDKTLNWIEFEIKKILAFESMEDKKND